MTAAAASRPGPVVAWKLAIRLPTLTASIAPVLVGTAVAIHEDTFDPLPALASLIGAICLQIGANLANDAFDFKRGADTTARLGPPRASSSGWLATSQVFAGMWIAFAIAFLGGVYLAFVGGWPIVVVGLVSILAAIAYTGGPWPLGYHALGDVATFTFFGPTAVIGTYFVQAGSVAPLAVAASLPVGFLVTAILVVNNLRDLETDRTAGKTTLAVLLGDRLTRAWYISLVLAAYAVAGAIALSGARPWLAGLFLSTMPFAIGPVRAVFGGLRGPGLNQMLKATARLNLVVGLVLSLVLAFA